MNITAIIYDAAVRKTAYILGTVRRARTRPSPPPS